MDNNKVLVPTLRDAACGRSSGWGDPV